MKLTAEIKNGVKGRYLVSVVDKDGNERFPLGTKLRDNLILDGGLNKLLQTNTNLVAGSAIRASHLWRMMAQCQVGTGSTPAAVTDTNLQAFVKNNSSVGAATGANGTTYDTLTGTATHKITFEFSPEVGTINYREVGFRGGAGNGLVDLLWSRVVFPSNVTVNNGEQIRIVYELTQVMNLLVNSKPVSLSSGTFNGEGDVKVVGTFAKALGFVAANGSLDCFAGISGVGGANVNYVGPLFTAFNGQVQFRLLTNNAFPSNNTAFSGTLVTGGSQVNTSKTWSTLGSSDFFRSVTFTISPTIPPSTSNVRAIMVGCHSDSVTIDSGIMWLFDSDQSKQIDYRLDFTIQVSWARL